MTQIMNMPIDTPINIYHLLKTLIEHKCINIKKSYKIYKDLIESDKTIIKNIYCKNKRPNGDLCLNKCIENSKCCKIHDPIMKENRKKMNLWKKESRKYNNIGHDIFQDEDNKQDNTQDNTLSYIPEYTKITIKPSAPLLQDIINPPDYIQKPDECGYTVINTINNQDIIKQEIHQEDKINKDNYKLLTVNHLYTPLDTSDLENRFKHYRNNSIINSNLIDYLHDYQFTILDKPVDNYLDNISSINFKDLQIKGIKSHRIINELIAINISSYYKAYNRIPSTGFFHKYANTISTIIKNIPK
jgi:hypothetical protein